MKEYSESQSMAADLPRWIDRLVDRELGIDDERQLLVALEAEPEGWRRCALAFIEAQSWEQELRSLRAIAAPAPVETTVAPKALVAAASPSTARKLHWFAMAACLLLAFALGAGANHVWLGQNKSAEIANQHPLAAPDERQVANAGSTLNSNVDSANRAQWQALKVTIPSVDGQPDQTVEVPFVEGSEQEFQSLLANQAPVLSDVTRKTLESTGHEIAERRAFYPVKLDDGRQAVLPMDYVEVRYTGGWQ